jgi:hypothetical protein
MPDRTWRFNIWRGNRLPEKPDQTSPVDGRQRAGHNNRDICAKTAE